MDNYAHRQDDEHQLPLPGIPDIHYGPGIEARVAGGPKAVLVTKNLGGVNGTLIPLYETDRTGEKTPMFIDGINGKTPVYVTTDPNYYSRHSRQPCDLILIDMANFPIDTLHEKDSELSILVEQSGPVVGIGKGVTRFPGHPLNGYRDMRFSYLRRILRAAEKLKHN